MSSTQGYPKDWPTLAILIKRAANWLCEECHAPHDPPMGYTLTVHHKDGNKSNLTKSNLIPLCQRCHLRRQARLRLYGPEDERQIRLPMEIS